MLDADNIKIIQIHTIAANSFDVTQGFVCLFIYLLFLIGLCIFVRSPPFLLSLLCPLPCPKCLSLTGLYQAIPLSWMKTAGLPPAQFHLNQIPEMSLPCDKGPQNLINNM